MPSTKVDPLLKIVASSQWQEPSIQRWWSGEWGDSSNDSCPYRCLEKTPHGPMIRYYDADFNCYGIEHLSSVGTFEKKITALAVRNTTRDFISQLLDDEKSKGYSSKFLYKDVVQQLIATEPVLGVHFEEISRVLTNEHSMYRNANRWKLLLNTAEYGWNRHAVPGKELLLNTAPAFKVHTLWMTHHQMNWEHLLKKDTIDIPLIVVPLGHSKPSYYVMALTESSKTYLLKILNDKPTIQLVVERQTPSVPQTVLKHKDHDHLDLVFGVDIPEEELAKNVACWSDPQKRNIPSILNGDELSKFLVSLITLEHSLDKDLVTSIWQWFEKESPEKAALISSLYTKPRDCFRMIKFFEQTHVMVAPLPLPSEFEPTP